MSGKGNCWDNAVVETFFATLKDELGILDGLIRDPEQLFAIFGYGSRGITTENDVIPPLAIAL
jgi:transposase InsO family protein